MYHKMVILFDTLSIFLPTTVLENCLETPGPLFVQFEFFLIEKSGSS